MPSAHRYNYSERKNARRKSKFSQSRVINSEEQTAESVEPDADEVEDLPSTESESESTKEVRPYSVLLDTFNIGLEQHDHRRKRRKIARSNIDLEVLEHQGIAEDHIEGIDSFSDLEEETRDENNNGPDDSDNRGSDDETEGVNFFQKHFDSPEIEKLEERILNSQNHGWGRENHAFGKSGTCTIFTPTNSPFEKPPSYTDSGLLMTSNMKSRLVESFKKIVESLGDIEGAALPYIFSYFDVLIGGRNVKNADNLRSLAVVHALNHVLKTRGRILKHNAILSSQKVDNVATYRDQGFTRPKVLFIVPTRNACAKVVNSIVSICRPEQQENRKRFEENYLSKDHVPEDRPEDFKELFDGNDDDMFRLGIKFTRKTIKFFTQFYNSDIILGSPLGLRRAIESGGSKKKDYDFLSSIEIVILDQTDSLLMQNWDHVTYVMSHLNLSPKEPHGCDFSRVRMWYLDDNSKYLRQTIVLSAFITPEINSLFNTYMSNVAGKIKYQPTYDGTMLVSGLHIKQSFFRFQSSTLQKEPDDRFSFFTSSIIPWILRLPRPADGAIGVVIFIPSYFDFVRIRNYFSTSTAVSSIAFGTLSENNTPAEPEVRRARSHFLSGRHSVLLYSGRAHHFYRYAIKGVRNVVVYQLPDNPLFYKEVVSGFIGASITAGNIAAEEAKVRVLLSKWDALRLERVVGTERVPSMLGTGDTFDFV